MVLAWPKDCTYTNAYVPAFDIKLIEDCFKLKKYPDPTKYLYVPITIIIKFRH